MKSTLARLALVSIAGASPIAQVADGEKVAASCGLAVDDPKSWTESGGEKLLSEWLDTKGAGKVYDSLTST